MNISTKVWEGGWGALFLTIYSVGLFHLLFPDNQFMKGGAVIITILVMYSVHIFNFHLVDYWAGGEARRSTEVIEDITGNSDFYESAEGDIQSRVDVFDKKVKQHNISILSGLIIGLTAPLFGYYFFSTYGLFGGVILAVLSIQLLVRRSIAEMNQIARDIVLPYEEKYEN